MRFPEVKSMLEILTKPENSIINQYKHLFQLDEIELTFTNGALKRIVKLAFKRNTGARALRAVIEEVMLEIMYEIPSLQNVKTCIINEDVINHKKSPILKFYKKTA